MSLLSATGGTVEASVGIDVDSPPSGVSTTTFTDASGDDYQIIAIQDTGDTTFEVDGTVDVLFVAGGGSGGGGQSDGHEAGGGGAGELVVNYGLDVSGTYTFTVGSGGAGVNQSAGNFGGDTVVPFVGTADGGGYGDSENASGGDGGSGGGGGHSTTNGGNSTADLGFGNIGTGGANNGENENVGGGGGGAGQAGGDEGGLAASEGGAGLDYSDDFSTQFGDNGAFAGGGQGGRYVDISGTDRIRSLGGGGISNDSGGGGDLSKMDAIQNTGSGGAGAWDGSSNIAGGDGADGIVLIRYQI